MKVLVAVIVLAILAGGVWMTRSGDEVAALDDSVETDTVDTDAVAQPADIIEVDEAPVSEAATAGETAVEDVVTEVDSEVVDDVQAVVEESDAASPFTTVDEPEIVAEPQISEPATLENSESVSSAADTTSTDQDGASNVVRKNVVVPQSYPVTDAAKYFIPKEERGPGNLGGPPPLDFPGGPSDPNGGDTGTTFTPPTAPGD